MSRSTRSSDPRNHPGIVAIFEEPMKESFNKRQWILCGLVAAIAVAAVWQWGAAWWRQSQPPVRTLMSTAVADDREHKHTNHLIHETSPYLLQHAHNPVNWYAWGPEALAKAKRENKPIFLSVGYSTCYWCHVMEQQSFEDEEVAKILNEHFICIKVDREERPDIDEQYMLATQIMTGRGGWPNSVWLTPDGRPWMAGTYFPKQQFIQVLNTLQGYWTNRHPEIEQQADRLAEAIRQVGAGRGVQADRLIDRELVQQAVAQLVGSFDDTWGGFGSAPKFPPHGALRLLIHEYRRTQDPKLLPVITKTLDAMWLGGMHDHIGGGFHRYSTDHRWLLPHFEKMLYDNAQLMRAYTDGYLITKTPRYRRAVEDIFRWIGREMTSPDGAFYSAIDSGEVGAEGESYVWHHKEVLDVLGNADGALFAEVYNLQPRGNFREESTGESTGANIVHLTRPLTEIAADRGTDAGQFLRQMQRMRDQLLKRRLTWAQPHKDDKVLTSWNGLMIASLAYAGRQLDESRYTEAAGRAAAFVLDTMTDDTGGLLRSYRAELAKLPGYLDDYAYFIGGLIELHRATQDPRWLDEAKRLSDVMLASFEDKQAGGFFFTADAHEDLLVRSKSLTGGGNVPSSNGVAVEVLIDLSQLTGERRYTEAAERTLKALSGAMWANPRAMEAEVLAAAQWLDRPRNPRKLPAVASQPASSSGSGGGGDPSDSPDVHQEQALITLKLYASHLTVRPGQTLNLALAIDIAEGWHLYGPNPDVEFVIPTTVSVSESKLITAGQVAAPQPVVKMDDVIKQKLATYEGRIWYRVGVTVNPDAASGAGTVPGVIEVVVKSQACDATRCLQPRTDTLRLPIVIDPDASPTAPPRHPKLFVSSAAP
ncbi:MAG: DUF255 domain-containing protein [Planctomycetes bacterium]|nr:DUF255 domain-containing protein [Planctomycetota bacterium]